jgi:uncharacterized delta-60 repeat protein
MRYRPSFIALAALALVLLAPGSPSAAGSGGQRPIRIGLDRTFGNRGALLAPIVEGIPRAAAVDRRKRIVVGGSMLYQEGVLARYLGAGRLDPSFGNGGIAGHQEAPGETISALAIDPSGRVVAGIGLQQKISVARFLPDGTLDRSFGKGGFTTVLIPPEAGEFGGGEDAKASSVTIDGQGRITVARVKTARTGGRRGTGFVLARFSEDGSLVPTFGDAGLFTATLTHSVPFQLRFAEADPAGGATVVATTFTSLRAAGAREQKRFEVVRWRPDGELDPGFGGGDGVTQVSVGRYGTSASVAAIDSQQRIVVGGSNRSGYGFARLLPAGTLDKRFGSGGRLVVRARSPLVRSGLRAIAIAADGRIVVSGRATPPGLYNDYFLAFRLSSRGKLDRSFGRGGTCAASFAGRQSYPTALGLIPGGDAVISGPAELPRPGEYLPTASRIPAFALARCDG